MVRMKHDELRSFGPEVTLGEPLQQSLSIRKFNRFLRDIGLVPTKGSRKMMLGDYNTEYNDPADRGAAGN